MLVKDILKLKSSELFSIGPESSLREAVSIMVEKDIGSLLVLENEDFIGKLTFREVLKSLSQRAGDITDVLVDDVMIKDTQSISSEKNIDEVREVMTENHIRYLPVVENGHLIGILSFHDIARAALKLAKYENTMLKRYIKNWPEEE